MMEGEIQSEVTNQRGFGEADNPETGLEEGEEQATEIEQQDYDMLVVRGSKIILGEGKNQILEMLGSSETPAQGLGTAVSMIIKSLTASSKEQGREIGADAMINAGSELVAELNELAMHEKIYTYDSAEEEEKEVTNGIMYGVKLFGDGMVESDEITPEMKQIAQKEVEASYQEEGKQPPMAQQTPMNSAVNGAMNPEQPAAPGIINKGMQGGMQ